MSRAILALATSLCLGGLLGCESAVLVNNDPGTDASTPNLNENNSGSSTADTAGYREADANSAGNRDTSANTRGGATTRQAMQVETKNVTVEKQRDNP
jgi:hypothetical protein